MEALQDGQEPPAEAVAPQNVALEGGTVLGDENYLAKVTMKSMELGFFEEFDDEEQGQEELAMHEDGNWMRWDEGLAGGPSPAWLVPFKDVEAVKELIRCKECERPMSFLLQVYAPLDEEACARAFHRTLFVFLCRNPKCASQAVVLRSQLPRHNSLYAATCVSADDEVDPLFDRKSAFPAFELGPAFPRRRIVSESEPKAGTGKCAVCFIPSEARCVACRVVSYCGKEHQKAHWPRHKKLCKLLQRELSKPLDDSDEGEEPLESGAAGLQAGTAEAQPRDEEGSSGAGEGVKVQDVGGPSAGKTDEEFTQDDFNEMLAGGSEAAKRKLRKDAVFDAFQDRIARDPEQCIRYCRWAGQPGLDAGSNYDEDAEDEEEGGAAALGPLWLAEQGRAGSVSPCPRCSAERRFEMQVLPQALYYLNELEADFGTICVYTCVASCALEEGEYAVEAVHVQRME